MDINGGILAAAALGFTFDVVTCRAFAFAWLVQSAENFPPAHIIIFMELMTQGMEINRIIDHVTLHSPLTIITTIN